VQETLLRAWKGIDSFEGRAAFRSWLYRIATNVCLDMLRGPQRRAQPIDLSAPWSADTPLPAPSPENTWVSPIADDRVQRRAFERIEFTFAHIITHSRFITLANLAIVPL
jgi:RNA polymerase sigma-70 factor (ECF subfamily)